MSFPSNGIFIAGTDTDVGKTYVTALLAKSLRTSGRRVGVYKPAASGGNMIDGRCVCDDATILWEAAGKPASVHEVCPQMFLAPLAPNVAAKAESRTVDSKLLMSGLEFWKDQCDIVLVEGAGGLLSPLSDDLYVADVALEIGYPVLIVTANRLGTINQTLQTLMTAEHHRGGLPVSGVVINDVSNIPHDESLASNPEALRERCSVRVQAHIRHGQESIDDLSWLGI